MSNKSSNPYKNQGIRDFLKSIPKEEVERNYKRQCKENDLYFKKFYNYYNKNKCVYCEHSLNSYIESKPCMHWLLLPDGIKKRD